MKDEIIVMEDCGYIKTAIFRVHKKVIEKVEKLVRIKKTP